MVSRSEQLKSVGDRARAIYDNRLRDLVEPEHHGEYLTLDVTTGEYEIGVRLVGSEMCIRDRGIDHARCRLQG